MEFSGVTNFDGESEGHRMRMCVSECEVIDKGFHKHPTVFFRGHVCRTSGRLMALLMVLKDLLTPIAREATE